MWTSYSKLFTCVWGCVGMCGDVCVCTIDVLHYMLRRCSRCSCVMPPTAQSTCKCISPTHNDITDLSCTHTHTVHTHTQGLHVLPALRNSVETMNLQGYIFVATYCFVFEVWALATPTAQVRSGCVTCAHLITRSSAFSAKERTVHIQMLQELLMNYHKLQYVSFWGRHCSITNPDSFVRIESATNLVLFSLPSHPTHTLLFLICNLSYTQHP